MNTVVVGDVEYLRVRDAAELWGLKPATIRKYASPREGKIPGCIKADQGLLVPVMAIRPITQPIAQGLLWGIVRIKNGQGFLDLTEYGLSNDQLAVVLEELARLRYVDLPDTEDVREQLERCRITERGLSLIEYRKRLKGNPSEPQSSHDRLALAFSAAQTLLQLLGMLGDM